MTQANDHPLQVLLLQLRLHSPLSESTGGAILGLPHRLKEHDAGTYLVREADRPTLCSVLIEGLGFRQKETAEGTRQIVSIHIPGELLDVQQLALSVADHSVQMLTRGRVAVIDQLHIRDLMAAEPEFADAIFRAVVIEASMVREWVLNVGRRDAPARLAHVLCEFAVRMERSGLSNGDGFSLPITQEQLADAVGLTTVHVHRTLKALQAKGLITREKRSISFASWQRLRDEADFNQRYLHLGSDLLPFSGAPGAGVFRPESG